MDITTLSAPLRAALWARAAFALVPFDSQAEYAIKEAIFANVAAMSNDELWDYNNLIQIGRNLADIARAFFRS